MTRIITYGTYDTLHYGHILLLQRAAALGDELIVALSSDEFNLKKGKASHFNYSDRSNMLSAIRVVNKIIPEHSWDQKIEDIQRYEIDIFTIGDDWAGKFDFLKDYCKVVYLQRTPDISTTLVKKAFSAI